MLRTTRTVREFLDLAHDVINGSFPVIGAGQFDELAAHNRMSERPTCLDRDDMVAARLFLR
jgi:hypothetical protein